MPKSVTGDKISHINLHMIQIEINQFITYEKVHDGPHAKKRCKGEGKLTVRMLHYHKAKANQGPY
jgi:hypothetical protein